LGPLRKLFAPLVSQAGYRPGCDPKKMVFTCFSANLGRHFLKSNNVGSHFAQVFRDFSKIFRDFVRIFRDFANIFRDFARIFNKSKLLGVHLHPLNPRLLHH